MRKYHARFLEGWATVRSPGYSAHRDDETISVLNPHGLFLAVYASHPPVTR